MSIKYHINTLGGKVAYSDTDSLVCNVELSDDLISGTKLGMMKLERCPTKGYFIAPKLYYQEFKNSKGDVEIYTKSKGYGGALTETQFNQLFNGESIHID